MNTQDKLPQRKHTRLKHFDYSSCGAYFITICTHNRQCILSRINVGGDVPDAPQCVDLLPFGVIADRYIQQLNEFYDEITIDQYVIMPNHIHILLIVSYNGASGTSHPTKQHSIVSKFVSTFKRFCNKEYGNNIWQTSFYDHIIRNKEDYQEIVKYIYQNPMQWYFDELYVDE